MKADQEGKARWALLAAWTVSTLVVAHFHEPWRDEAQAWLVARSSSTLHDLLYRSSLEATGPLYYLLLWPWARAFPLAFPAAIFWISWAGTFSAVALLLLTRLLPPWVAAMAAFGYLFGYEYPVIARLYGWGSLLLLAGILADQRGRRRFAALFLSLACLVQLNFVFAAGAWCVFQVLSEPSGGDRARRMAGYFPLVFSVYLALVHLAMSFSTSALVDPELVPRWNRIGSSVITPFIQSRGKIGWAGLLVFPMVLAAIDKRGRLALLVGIAPFLALFAFVYSGGAMSRHGGPLFLVWLVLTAVAPAHGPWARRSLAALLGFSLLTGIEVRVRDILVPYSDGQGVADTIAAIARSRGKRPRVFMEEDLVGFVIAARLGEPIWTGMGRERVDYPAFTVERALRVRRERSCPPWESYAQACRGDDACFFVGRTQYTVIPTELESRLRPVYTPSRTISDESLFACELISEPTIH
jgi:hypothetical protein